MFLKTERLLLREFKAEDWAAVLVYQTDPRYLRYYAWESRTEADVRQFVQMFIDYQHEQPRTRFQLAAILQSEGRLIGNCGIRKKHPAAIEAELGYEFAPGYWGHGYATEAASRMLRFGFRTLGLHRIFSLTIAENTGSVHVLEKIGMQYEGRLRENEWMKGRWWDTLIYSILKHEWSENEGI